MTQQTADAAAKATETRPETATDAPPIHGPGGVYLSAHDAENIAAWLRAHLAEHTADNGDGDALTGESIVALGRWVCVLEQEPGFE
jgi:hypothetical protein